MKAPAVIAKHSNSDTLELSDILANIKAPNIQYILFSIVIIVYVRFELRGFSPCSDKCIVEGGIWFIVFFTTGTYRYFVEKPSCNMDKFSKFLFVVLLLLYNYYTPCHTISKLLAREACRASKSLNIILSRGLPRVISTFSNTRLAEFWKCRYRMTGGVITVFKQNLGDSEIW